jgi:phage gp16-like protein
MGAGRREQEHRQAEVAADDAAVQAEVANLRAQRAETTRAQFKNANALEPLAELQPRADAAVSKLETAKADLAAGHQEWAAVTQEVGELLAEVDGATARSDAPAYPIAPLEGKATA